MAFRRPLKIDGNGNLQEMTDSDITLQALKAYGYYCTTPSVYVYHSWNNGNIGAFYDTFLESGAYSTSTTGYVPETQTAEPVLETITYNALRQTRITSINYLDLLTYKFKGYLYFDGSGGIREMSHQDMVDTFVGKAINDIAQNRHILLSNRTDILTVPPAVSGYTASYSTYRIGTFSSLVVKRSSITESYANLSSFTADAIPDDGFRTVKYYDLYVKNGFGTSSGITVAMLDSDNNIRGADESMQSEIAGRHCQHAAVNTPGARLEWALTTDPNWGTYNITTISDRRYNGTGNYQQRFVDADDYRSQEFPNGTLVVNQTYYFKARVY